MDPAMTWQPIDSAPLDGTHVLVVYPMTGTFHLEREPPRRISVAYWFVGPVCPAGRWRADDKWVEPTHWMPLPELPAGEEAAS
jgi:hypothetical protein